MKDDIVSVLSIRNIVAKAFNMINFDILNPFID